MADDADTIFSSKREGQESFSYFSNFGCPYFPCHAGADPGNFNCLFCYCPLYLLGRHCGGSFIYNQKGIKVCTNCLYPHKRENYRAVTRKAFSRMRRVISLVDKASLADASESAPEIPLKEPS